MQQPSEYSISDQVWMDLQPSLTETGAYISSSASFMVVTQYTRDVFLSSVCYFCTHLHTFMTSRGYETRFSCNK